MKFQVPQFIEVEDKIFGPLTLSQFLYLAGGGAAIFLLYISLPFFLFIILGMLVGALAVALAFYKIHNKPLINVAENGFNYLMKNKIYTWKKREPEPQKIQRILSEKETPPTPLPALTKNKLRDLAWSLDIKQEIEKN
ncbi:PrgI family protein [Patescibacteria group bacterium]|nr:PrgI family protein [Patescibacteria group bacterium]